MDAHQFYSLHGTVFLTGATGFLGKSILEMMLRNLPAVKKVLVLTRISEMKPSLADRILHEILDSRIFDVLKQKYSSPEEFSRHVSSRIVPVKGDILLDNFGLSDADIAMVQAETHVVINCAASVSFEDPLEAAIEYNVKAPLRLLDLTKNMPNLAGFVQVSTAFVNSFMTSGQTVQETLYPIPFGDANTIFDQLQKMTPDQVDEYEREKVLSVYPNTYTFTKSLAEQLMASRNQTLRLPLVMVRPSIITSTVAEPMPGWIEGRVVVNNSNLAVGMGLVQEWIGNGNCKVDIVPVDVVSKTILMAATVASFEINNGCSLPIFHSTTTGTCPVDWQTASGLCLLFWNSVITRHKLPGVARYVGMFSEEEFEKRFQIRFGALVEAVNDPNMSAKDKKLIQKQILGAYMLPQLIKHFMSNEWYFDSKNTQALDKMAVPELCSKMDQGIDWKSYIPAYNEGLLKFILKEEIRFAYKPDYSDESLRALLEYPKATRYMFMPSEADLASGESKKEQSKVSMEERVQARL